MVTDRMRAKRSLHGNPFDGVWAWLLQDLGVCMRKTSFRRNDQQWINLPADVPVLAV